MKAQFFLLVFNCAIVLTMHRIPNFYHTTDQLNQEVNQILERCPFATKTQLSANPNIYSLTFDKMSAQPKNKAFIIFGEHSREMISPETGLFLIQSLCSQQQSIYSNILSQYTIQIILNMNPNSRKYVERGFYCLRENHNGVDLNRNYDIQWEHVEDHQYQISSGERPFSEVETQNVKKILEQFKPDVFLSIHSGTLALLHPYAYKAQKCNSKRNYKNIHDVATQVGKEFCDQCLIGSAAEEIGYTASGSSQDYAYDVQNVKYSYTFEIHSRENTPSGSKRTDSENGHLFLHSNHHHHHSKHHHKPSHHNENLLLHHHYNKHHKKQSREMFIQQVDAFHEPISNFGKFLQEKDKTKHKVSQSEQFCFMYFNPVSEAGFKYETKLWSKAIARTLELIYQKENEQ